MGVGRLAVCPHRLANYEKVRPVILDFLAGNAGTIIAVLALVAALQANAIPRKSKTSADRMLISEKKRELIQEIDRQHVSLIRLRFVMQGQQLQLQLCPECAIKKNMHNSAFHPTGYSGFRPLSPLDEFER